MVDQTYGLSIKTATWDKATPSSVQRSEAYSGPGVTPDSCLGNKSDIFHHNNKNNQLKRRVRPLRDIH